MTDRIRIRRTTTVGKVPTTLDLQEGELGLNTIDKKLYSSDGTSVFEIGNTIKSYSSLNTDITSLISGTTSGNLFEGITNGHFVIGIKSNDAQDGFHILDKGNATSSNTDPYLNRLFSVSRSLGVSTTLPVSAPSFSGNGALLTNLNASNISTGTVNVARIPTGTTETTVALGNHNHAYLPLAGGTLTGALGLPSSAGIGEIKTGTGDGAGFTLYNTTIRSWWGIGFRDYTDNSTVKVFIDCRTGNIGSSGTISATSFSGSGASLTALNASNIASGAVNIARIPTGTTSTTVSLGNHTHNYLPLAGGILSDALTIKKTVAGAAFEGLTIWNDSEIASTSAVINLIANSAGAARACQILSISPPGGNSTSLIFKTSHGTLPTTVLTLGFDLNATFASSVTATSFSGSGASLTALNASNLASGTVADARLSSNVVLLTGTQTISGAKTFSNGIIQGSTPYPTYEANVEFGADAANTWRRIINVISSTGLYATIGFKIEVTDAKSNQAGILTVDNIITETYYVACVRTETDVQNTPDACYVRGPGNRIRATKTATGTYQIQIQNEVQYREYIVRISVYASNGNHTVTYHAGDTATAGIAQYNATVSGTSREIFQNITTRQLTSNIATGTAPFVVTSTTEVTNLNADLLDGQQGSYYLNASNLASGTVPDARISGIYSNITGLVRTGTTGSFVLTSGTGTPGSGAVIQLFGSTHGTYAGQSFLDTSIFNLRSLDGTVTYLTVNSSEVNILGRPLVLTAGTTTIQPLRLQTGVNLTTPVFGSVEFDGTNLYLTNNSVTPVRKTIAFTDSTIVGNASTATTLQVARNINGTAFNGSVDIITTTWGTIRNITIGSTGKSVDGSSNVAWTLAEIGAQAALGFTPVQQGGGTGQGTNKLYIGWRTDSTLGLQIDVTNFGSTWPINISGTATTLQTARTIALSGGATGTATSFNGGANITIPVTDLNASNLSSGTIPDGRLNSSYTGIISLSANLLTSSSGIKIGGSYYPSYEANIDFLSDPVNTWKRLVNVVCSSILYSTIGFCIEIIDLQANHAIITSVHTIKKETYYVACVRTESTTFDSPDACYVTGPSDRIRAVKTSIGTYEIQIQNASTWREYKVSIYVYASNGNHTVNYYAGDTASVGIAQYNASVSATAREDFQNVSILNSLIVTGNIGLGITTPATKLESAGIIRVNSNTQFTGFAVSNGAYTIAQLQGSSITNDNGVLTLRDTGVPKVQIISNGISYLNGGNVGIGTTTPTETLHVIGNILATGVITATSFSGSGTSITSLNASNLSSGTVPTVRLGSGTANTTTFLRGDNTWQTISTGYTTLAGLTDTTITTPANGNFLRHNGTSWVNIAASYWDQSNGGAYYNDSGYNLNNLVGGDNVLYATTVQNSPSAAVSFGWVVTHNQYTSNTNDLIQISHPFRDAGHFAYRNKNSTGVWGSWKTLYSDIYHPDADKWTTARTLTIGSTGKSVDGSSNISWTLAEIGAAASTHTHTYLPLAGGTLTGHLGINNTLPTITLQDTDQNSAFIHVNSNQFYILRGDVNAATWTQVGGVWPLQIDLTNNNATFGGSVSATSFSGSGASLTSLNASNISTGTLSVNTLPTGTTSTTVALGNHTHAYLPLTGGTLTGNLSITGSLIGTGAGVGMYEPSPLGTVAGNTQLLWSKTGLVSNVASERTWIRRRVAGTDWQTALFHNGITVDVSFGTPGVDTRAWWERDIQTGSQFWGNANTTFFSVDSSRFHIPLTTPSTSTTTGALIVSGGVGVAGSINAGAGITAGTNLTLANQGELRLSELTANGTNYVALRSPANVAANITLTLPATLGANGQVLVADASGNLSWANNSADNLGNHTATTTLNMANQGINNVSYVWATNNTGGYAYLSTGTAAQSGRLDIYKPNGTTRLGYIGWDPTDLTYVAEGGANHKFLGGGLILEASGYTQLSLNNTLKTTAGLSTRYVFYNMAAGDAGGIGQNCFCIYSYNNSNAKSIPFTILDNDNVGIGTASPAAKLHVSGGALISSLAGTGSRMVVADAAGVLSTNALPVSSNLYTADGALASNRVVAMGANSLSFIGSIPVTFKNYNATAGTIATSIAAARLFRDGTHNVAWPQIVDFALGKYKAGHEAGTQLDIKMADGGTGDIDVTVMSILGNGNVGIGTVAPTNRFEVKGLFGAPANTGSAQNGIARFSQTSGLGSLDFGFGDPYSWIQSRSSGNYSTNYNLALNPNGGNVGIGTTSPGAKLTVSGGEGTYNTPNFGQTNLGAINILNTTSNRRNGITFSAAGVSNAQAGIYVHQDNGSGTTMYLATTDSYLTGPQTRLTILNNGNVGIGTASPAASLHMYQDRYTLYGPNSTWGAYLQVGGNSRVTSYASVAASNGNLHIDAANGSFATYINFHSQNNTYINAQAGNVGIGTSGPSQKLDVAGNINLSGALIMNGTTVIDSGGGWHRTYGATGWYNSTYEGGMYMIDTTWVRTYNGKSLYSQGNLGVAGAITVINGISPTNGAIRMTGNLHLNASSENGIYINWDSGGSVATSKMLVVGNGSSGEVMYVRRDGLTASNIFHTNKLEIAGDTLNRFELGKLVIRGYSPTLYFRDYDNASAMIHCNSNILYFLRGGVDTESWSGVYPLTLNLSDGAATFGGAVSIPGTVGIGATVNAPFYRTNGTTNGATGIASGSCVNTNAQIELTIPSYSNNTVHISFHKPGVFASNFGLDADNQFACGGWSSGNGYAGFKAGMVSVHNGLYVHSAPPQYASSKGNSTALLWNAINGGQGTTEFVNYAGAGGGDSFGFFRIGGADNVLPTNTNRVSRIDISGNYIVTSDKRVKGEFQYIPYAIDLVKKLKPWKYNHYINNTFANNQINKGNSFIIKYGFVAQEVLEIIPEAVSKPLDTDDLYGLDYTVIIPILTKAIQEQQDQIDVLKTTVQILMSKIQGLETT